jgi:hypothetical protein
VEHAVVVRVLPGQVRGARRAAQREARDGVVEARAVAAEQGVRVLHRRQRGRRLVVGHDHDDVLARERRAGEGERGRRGGARAR